MGEDEEPQEKVRFEMDVEGTDFHLHSFPLLTVSSLEDVDSIDIRFIYQISRSDDEANFIEKVVSTFIGVCHPFKIKILDKAKLRKYEFKDLTIPYFNFDKLSEDNINLLVLLKINFSSIISSQV